MSPRAAWRLESLGFTEVYDYVAGKADWAAYGLPTEGELATKPRAGTVARRDVSTCRPDECLGDIRDRIAASGHDLCVVTNEMDIVLGILRAEQLASPDERRASEVMRPGPSTFRPNVPIEDMAEFMTGHDLVSAPVTSPDGRLLGVLFRDDAVAAGH